MIGFRVCRACSASRREVTAVKPISAPASEIHRPTCSSNTAIGYPIVVHPSSGILIVAAVSARSFRAVIENLAPALINARPEVTFVDIDDAPSDRTTGRRAMAPPPVAPELQAERLPSHCVHRVLSRR